MPHHPGSIFFFIYTNSIEYVDCFNIGALINYRVAIPVCLPVHPLAIHIVYIGFNSFKNVGPTFLANGRIMCRLRSSCYVLFESKLEY